MTVYVQRFFEQAAFQPGQIEFILQVCFGGDKHRIMILQKAQDAVQRREVMAQSVKALYHDGIDAPLLHSGKHGKQGRTPEFGAVLLLHAGVDDDVTAPVGFAHDFCKLFFQCGQVRCGAAGERQTLYSFMGAPQN